MTGAVRTALTIAGSDSGGGAGIQADLKTFAALGVHGASAITALTAQNTLGVGAIFAAPPAIVRAQIDAVVADFCVVAIKIGMLANAEIAEAVAEAIRLRDANLEVRREESAPRASSPPVGEDRGGGSRRTSTLASASNRLRGRRDPPPCPAPTGGAGTLLVTRSSAVNGTSTCDREGEGRPFVVYDPVLAATSGDALAGAGFLEAVRAKVLPRVDCLTPNLPEAAALLGAREAASEAAMIAQGQALLALGPGAVLMKGGHLAGEEAVDLLVTADGVRRFAAPKIASPNTHGTGCTLSSAIAAHVALGLPLAEAVAAAKAFVGAAIERGAAARLGHGPGPLVQLALVASAPARRQDRA